MLVWSTLASANLPVRVLELEGSKDSLEPAVREVARATRGARILAITSAFRPVTEPARSQLESAPPDVLASLLAACESTAAASFSLSLHAAGIPNELLDPDRVRLVARGPALHAEPSDVDAEAIEKALTAKGVAVIPGLIGRRSSGRRVFLDRGGSALTALFLAERIGAEECRLVRTGELPGRYRQASWEEILQSGGSLVRREAVEFARRHRLSFTVAGPLSTAPTRVGPLTELVS